VIDFTGDFFANGLGSKYSFHSHKFTFNKYVSLSDKQVLAYNFHLCGTGGQPPFYGQCIYGTSSELRGYTAGRYLDRYICNPLGIPAGSSLAFRLGWLWRR
jgi:outer membrane protein assembly factor BamA